MRYKTTAAANTASSERASKPRSSMATMEAAAFLAGAGIVSAGLTLYKRSKASKERESVVAFEKRASTGIVKSPFTIGDPTEVEHFTVPHLSEFFEEVSTFEK